MKKIFMLVLIIGAVVCGILVNSEGSVSGMYPSMYPIYTPDPSPVCPPWMCEPTATPAMPVCVHVGSVPVVDPVVATPIVISKSDTIPFRDNHKTDYPILGYMLMRMR